MMMILLDLIILLWYKKYGVSSFYNFFAFMCTTHLTFSSILFYDILLHLQVSRWKYCCDKWY